MNDEKSETVPEKILAFWFGELNPNGQSDERHSRHWFMKDEAFDQAIRERFGAVHAQLAASGHRPAWMDGPRGLLAAIIVLDQFSRNMFRGTPAMFSTDKLGRTLAFELIALGYDKKLPLAMRTFCYLPLMHSEKLAHQERCIELFEALVDELPEDLGRGVAQNIKYAIAHRDIVARFGRFPHRNEILGRTSSPEEIEFLAQPGSSF